MILDYLVVGFVVLALAAAALLSARVVVGAAVTLVPHSIKAQLLEVYEGATRLVRRFYRWLYLKDWDYSQPRPNRKLSPKEIMEREALRRGICPDCGVDSKKAGGTTALGGRCPYHTDF